MLPLHQYIFYETKTNQSFKKKLTLNFIVFQPSPIIFKKKSKQEQQQVVGMKLNIY